MLVQAIAVQVVVMIGGSAAVEGQASMAPAGSVQKLYGSGGVPRKGS